jgi:PTH1 family peptidyl-tRNA hydrolase
VAQPSKLIVGLGNPGTDYLFNRHNIGYMAVDVLAESCSASAWQKKFKGHLCRAEMGPHGLLLLKPATFMNLSGESVKEATDYFKIAPEDVIVFHDDIDLVSDQVRVKQGGGHGGHNGLRSLDAHIGKNYWRVRLGVGRPEHKSEVSDYVLGNFSKTDKTWLEPLLGAIPPALPHLLEGKTSKFIEALHA